MEIKFSRTTQENELLRLLSLPIRKFHLFCASGHQHELYGTQYDFNSFDRPTRLWNVWSGLVAFVIMLILRLRL